MEMVMDGDSFYGTKKATAERYAAEMAKSRIGEFALGMWNEPADPLRIVVRYDVEHWGLGLFGVVEKWRYADQPNGYVFGGGFTALSTIRRLIAE
jgi:hypothetical protein